MTAKAYGLDNLRVRSERFGQPKLTFTRVENREWHVAVFEERSCASLYISTQDLESLGHWALAAARAPLDDGLEEIRRYGT